MENSQQGDEDHVTSRCRAKFGRQVWLCKFKPEAESRIHPGRGTFVFQRSKVRSKDPGVMMPCHNGSYDAINARIHI